MALSDKYMEFTTLEILFKGSIHSSPNDFMLFYLSTDEGKECNNKRFTHKNLPFTLDLFMVAAW